MRAAAWKRAMQISRRRAAITHVLRGGGAAEHGRAPRGALEERIVADYRAGKDFPTARGQKLLTRAEAFVAAAQAFLDRPTQ